MYEVGRSILQVSQYAMRRLSRIKGVKCPRFDSPHFKEFVVDFNESSKRVSAINAALQKQEIFGGKDLSKDYPELGQSALYCFTEMHTQEDINRLAKALKIIIEK
jgi:glycine dehydrogenase subunit 1